MSSRPMTKWLRNLTCTIGLKTLNLKFVQIKPIYLENNKINIKLLLFCGKNRSRTLCEFNHCQTNRYTVKPIDILSNQ